MSFDQGAPAWVELIKHILDDNANNMRTIQKMFHENNKNVQAVSEALGALTMYMTSGGGQVGGGRTWSPMRGKIQWFYEDGLYPLCFTNYEPTTGTSAIMTSTSPMMVNAIEQLDKIGKVDPSVIDLACKSAKDDRKLLRFHEVYAQYPMWETFMQRFLLTYPAASVLDILGSKLDTEEQDSQGNRRAIMIYLKDQFVKLHLRDTDIQSLWRNIVWRVFGVAKLCKEVTRPKVRMNKVFDDFCSSYLYFKKDLEEYTRVLEFLLARLYVVAFGDIEMTLNEFNTGMEAHFRDAGAEFIPVDEESTKVNIPEMTYNKVFEFYKSKMKANRYKGPNQNQKTAQFESGLCEIAGGQHI